MLLSHKLMLICTLILINLGSVGRVRVKTKRYEYRIKSCCHPIIVVLYLRLGHGNKLFGLRYGYVPTTNKFPKYNIILFNGSLQTS